MSPHPGYAFIPLPDSVERELRPHARHDMRVANTHSGTLALTWIAEQPIHIGSGFKSLIGDKRSPTIIRQLVRLGDIPCIPGSSLKGALRARYEAITRSCASSPKANEPGRQKMFKIRSSSYGKLGVEFATLLSSATAVDALTQCRRESICPACALFGLLDLRSRITISDALPEDLTIESARIPTQFAPNLHHVGRFSYNKRLNILEIDQFRGRKFAVGCDRRPPPSDYSQGAQPAPKQALEVIPRGTHLHNNVRFINLTRAELGGMLAALGHAPKSRLKVGGGKSHGLGRLHLADLQLTPRPGDGAKPDLLALAAAFQDDSGCHAHNLDRLVALHGENC